MDQSPLSTSLNNPIALPAMYYQWSPIYWVVLLDPLPESEEGSSILGDTVIWPHLEMKLTNFLSRSTLNLLMVVNESELNRNTHTQCVHEVHNENVHMQLCIIL